MKGNNNIWLILIGYVVYCAFSKTQCNLCKPLTVFNFGGASGCPAGYTGIDNPFAKVSIGPTGNAVVTG